MRFLTLGFFVISLGSACTSWAQTTTLQGVVVAAGTKEAVPFAVVELRSKKIGTQASATGGFTLPIPQALTASDTIHVSALGYVAQQFAGVTSPCKLVLLPRAVTLEEVVIRAPVSGKQVFGPTARKSHASWGSTGQAAERGGFEVARFFHPAAEGTIQRVAYFISAHQECKGQSGTPFRVRVYAADGPDGMPGTDLLTTTMLTAAKRPGWHTVALNSGIQFPAQGFYVAMEWVYTAPQFSCSRTIVSSGQQATHISYGQLLGCIEEEKQNCWYYSPGYGWRQHRWPASHSNGFINPLIQAQVEL